MAKIRVSGAKVVCYDGMNLYPSTIVHSVKDIYDNYVQATAEAAAGLITITEAFTATTTTDTADIVPDLPGLSFKGACNAGMAASTTAITITSLAGYGNDYFNGCYYMQVVKNANNVGAAPQAQIRKITDYTSATGAFVTDAFGAAVQENDEVVILHESLIALGRNDADNIADTTNVAANADGSVLERLEAIKGQVGAPVAADISHDIAAVKTEVDKLGNPVGASFSADIAAVKTEVDKLGVPAGASVSVDIAAIKTEVDKLGNPAGASLAVDIAAVKTEVDKITDLHTDVSTVNAKLPATISKEITFNGAVSYTAFTVTGGVAIKAMGYITEVLSNHADTTSVGTASSAAGLIAATAGTAMQTANTWWVDAGPSKFETFPANYVLVGDGEDIVVVGTANLAAGKVVLYCTWYPLTSDGNVVAAA